MALAHHHGTFQLTDEHRRAGNDRDGADAVSVARDRSVAPSPSGVRDLSLRLSLDEAQQSILGQS